MADMAAGSGIAEEDILRADLYDMLAALLARPPTPELLSMVKGLSGDSTPLGQGISAMARLAGHMKPPAVAAEFSTLFIGLTRGELLPYASYYMTGFLHEKPLAALRTDMSRLQIERAPNVFEPEDNIASLCEMMAGLIRGRFGRIAGLDVQKDFHAKHIAPWAAHFFSDLEAAKASVFFAPVGTIGKAFMEIEREAFRMGA